MWRAKRKECFSMVDKNIGSIATEVFDSISPMPNNISGLLITIVENEQFFIEQFTGENVTDPIQDKFKPNLTDLSIAHALKLMAVQDFGVKSVRVQDIQTDNSNLKDMSAEFHARAIFGLKSLSKGLKVFKARG